MCIIILRGIASADNRVLRLATTTSTDNSGLLEFLLPQFERAHNFQVRVISVGTGKALRLGESGDVDVLLVHAPHSERRFMASGHGVRRESVMANDFIIVGPKHDPANLRAAKSVGDALRALAKSQHRFISRGDDSGTHKKELALWAAAGVANFGAWRLEAGQPMGKSLQIADELQAYLLIDRSTWIFLGADTALAVAYQMPETNENNNAGNDDALHNPYGIMAVNPARHAVNFAGATALIDWLTSAQGQAAIGAYRVRGIRLFKPQSAKGRG